MRRPTSRSDADLQRSNPLDRDSGGQAKGPTEMSAVGTGQEEASRLQPFTLSTNASSLEQGGNDQG